MAKPKGIKTINAERPYFVPIIYADPGVGKTYLAATSARENNDTLIIKSPVDHTETIAIHFPEIKIDEWVVHTWQDADEIHEYLRHENHGYRWVWADTLPLIQDAGLDDIMDLLVEEKDHRNLYVPDRGEYLENMNRLRRWVKHMAALDFNFGMTSHVERYTFYSTGEEMMMPWVQGKQMPEKICAYANVVGWLTTVEHEDHGRVRVLYTETHDEYYAKDGFGAFGGRIVRPTIPKMEKAVEKAKKKEASKKKKKGKKAKAASTDENFTF